LPGHWDSARLVAGVAGSIALAGSIVLVVPDSVRNGAIGGLVLFHFTGILMATTWPGTHGQPPPYLTNQLANRVYLPYFRFMYLGNAYHFYSPDPGPASHLFFLVEGEIDEPAEPDPKTGQVPTNPDGTPQRKKRSEWIDLPRRDLHYRDPLGLSYYRRLSITELVSYSAPPTPSWERTQAIQNRRNNELGLTNRVPIPGSIVGNDIDMSQYRPPQLDIRRHIHPSYARHIAIEYSGPRKIAEGKVVNFEIRSVKMFQVEHRIINASDFLPVTPQGDSSATPPAFRLQASKGANPFSRTLYLPYYLGEFDRDGKLTSPNDPLLYWMLPVLRDPNDQKKAIDNMSKYAGFEFDWTGKE